MLHIYVDGGKGGVVGDDRIPTSECDAMRPASLHGFECMYFHTSKEWSEMLNEIK